MPGGKKGVSDVGTEREMRRKTETRGGRAVAHRGKKGIIGKKKLGNENKSGYVEPRKKTGKKAL